MSDNEWEVIEGELESVLGDADTTSMVTNALSELISTGGKMGADKQAKDAAAAKQKAAQAQIATATANLQAAQAAAAGEKDPNGPLHQKLNAAQVAMNAANQAAGVPVSLTPPGGAGKHAAPTGGSFLTTVHGGLPTYGWLGLGLGFAGAMVAIVKLAGHSTPARGRR